MELMLLVAVIALAVALPVKCYNDGQYKIKCLEMRGTVQMRGDEVLCTPEVKP